VNLVTELYIYLAIMFISFLIVLWLYYQARKIAYKISCRNRELEKMLNDAGFDELIDWSGKHYLLRRGRAGEISSKEERDRLLNLLKASKALSRVLDLDFHHEYARECDELYKAIEQAEGPLPLLPGPPPPSRLGGGK
jgi:hypothetical protein